MQLFTRTKTTDTLNTAHTLGSNAVLLFESLATDLESAVELADQAYAEATAVRTEAGQRQVDANDAAVRYGNLSQKLRELVG